MELSAVNEIFFIGIEIVKNGNKFEAQVYENQQTLIYSYTSTITPINAVKTLRYRQLYTEPMPYLLPQRLLMQNEVKLRSIFNRLAILRALLIPLSITFFFRNALAGTAERNTDDSETVRISLPFKDQVIANAVRQQLRDLSHKILPTLQPVFVSKKSR